MRVYGGGEGRDLLQTLVLPDRGHGSPQRNQKLGSGFSGVGSMQLPSQNTCPHGATQGDPSGNRPSLCEVLPVSGEWALVLNDNVLTGGRKGALRCKTHGAAARRKV